MFICLSFFPVIHLSKISDPFFQCDCARCFCCLPWAPKLSALHWCGVLLCHPRRLEHTPAAAVKRKMLQYSEALHLKGLR